MSGMDCLVKFALLGPRTRRDGAGINIVAGDASLNHCRTLS